MEVQVEQTGPTQRKLSITVPADEVKAAFDKVFRQFGKTARIPGFRQGKIPRGLLEAHFGDQVRSEVQSELVGSSLARAMEQSSISPVSMPRIEPGALQPNTDFSYSADVEVQPEIELKKYKGLPVPKLEVQVDDEELKADLDSMREQATQLVPVLDRDVVQEGDVVVMDYQATMGGIPIEKAKAEGAFIEVGGEGYLPGLSDGLVGAKVPGKRDVPVKFPEDYSHGELGGKEATFHVELKELKRKDLPELNDEFAKDVGAESLEQLEERVRGSIKVRKEREAQQEQRQKLLEALVEANPFDVPPSMVEAQAEHMIRGAAERVQQLMGQSFNLNAEELESLRKSSARDAELQVRSGLLLLEVAKKEGLEVTPEDFEAEIEKMAEQAGGEAKRVRAHYSDPEQRSQLRYRILEDKTLSFLLEQAEETDTPTEPNPEAATAKEGDESTAPKEGE